MNYREPWETDDGNNSPTDRSGDTISGDKLIDLSANIVAAYVSKNTLSHDEVPDFLRRLHATMVDMKTNAPDTSPQPRTSQEPAIPVDRSVTPDYIICLEDGKPFKSLRRHLWSAYQMTPEDYREKWGLPEDYPMVAPNYSKLRSNVARQHGLGKSR